jgi:HTH-type transcriptional regulator/antitoxin HigA
MGTLTLDAKKYGRLLARTAPVIIESEDEYSRILGEIENLMDRGGRRTAEEDALLPLLVRLVEDYEEKAYPVRNAPPHEVLRYLMERRGLRQADLVPVFKSRGYVSDIVNGKRGIRLAQARKLAEFFKVSINLFL